MDKKQQIKGKNKIVSPADYEIKKAEKPPKKNLYRKTTVNTSKVNYDARIQVAVFKKDLSKLNKIAAVNDLKTTDLIRKIIKDFLKKYP